MEVIFGILAAVVVICLLGIRIVNQYERGVVLTLGKYSGMKSPGLRIVIPILQVMHKVDTRTNAIDIPRQEVITKDNVTVGVDAIVYFRVIDAAKATLEINNYAFATSQFAGAALRDITGNFELDELLSRREEISQRIKEIVDAQTDKWGIDVENVKLQNIELPDDMKRAMARQAEAERTRRAAVITAEGEKASAKAIAEAAEMLAKATGGMNIRTLQTLEKIAREPSQKTVIVVPADIAGSIGKIIGK
jgi:regulator of protease activity HflC (stomatin/prohibitin superfamily)